MSSFSFMVTQPTPFSWEQRIQVQAGSRPPPRANILSVRQGTNMYPFFAVIFSKIILLTEKYLNKIRISEYVAFSGMAIFITSRVDF